MSFAWHEIRDHLMRTSSTLTFLRGFEAIRGSQDAVADIVDPASLLDQLHCDTGDADRKNQMLRALVAAAQGDGPGSDCALTMLLLALWPGLDAIRRRSIWRKLGTVEEVASDLMARTTIAIRCLKLVRVKRIAATILMNVERDMIRDAKHVAARAFTRSDVDPDDVPSDRTGHLADVEDVLLRRDLTRVIGTDAALVIRVAVEGRTQAEVGVDLGLTPEAARKRYQRARKLLQDFLQGAA